MKSGRGHPHYKGGTHNHSSRSSSKNDDPNIRQRNYLHALIHKKEANVANFHMANRFVEAMNTYSDKTHLLQMLDNSREFGSARIREVLSYLDTIQSVESLLIPILRNILTNETARPLMRRVRNRILMTLFTIPDLLEVLVELDAPSNLTWSSANLLCNFLMEISLAFLEARSSDSVRILALELRKLGGIVKADCLCAILYVDEYHNTSILVASDAREGPIPWGSDFRPPGGRHDNDFLNFRDIRVFPTLNEIRSEIPNYLPMACGSNAIIQDLGQRLLDTNFRLLREDALFSMKECLAERRRPWKGAHIVDVHCKGNFRNENAICSLSFVIQCSANKQRKIDWERSNALSFGSLVALCHGQEVVRLGKISIRDMSRRDQWLNAPNGPQIGVTFLSEQEFNQSIKEMESNMVLREVGKLGFHQDKIEQTLKNDLVMYDLVEISQSFSTYEPILSAIQSMQEVPLMEELVHYSHTKPNYLPSKLNLPNDEFLKGATLDLQAWDTEQILKSTSLDVSQIDALHHTFTSRVSLIQGPPGTGKTFIGGAIARIIRENTNETILCVCYTNHALDQFLEHMLDAGETRLVRIGGRSRSSRITPYQLRELASRRNSFVSDRSRVRQIDAQLHNLHEQMDVLISQLKSTVTWTSPNGGVEQHLIEHADEDVGICFRIPHQAEYFTMVGKKNKKISKDVLLEAWLKGEDAPLWIYPYIEDSNFDIFHRYWDLSLSERWRLYEEWRHQVLDFKTFRLFNIIHEFNDRLSEKQDILRALDINVLNDARIIGVTTTGAAQYRDVLAHADPGIVIIEEAGEVLEAHVLSSLRTSSKHLILIGDHKQLRPKTESYCLTTAAKKGYNLDQSLFERLVLSRLSSISLCVQHRMRPQISEFIRTQTYPSLIDHNSVFKRPHVKGVTMDVAFINHNVPEDGQGDDDNNPKTKSNSYEAELCIEIVRFFLLQGYKPSDVVVLTPYLGQLFVITSLMKRELKEVSIYVSEKDTKELEILGSDELDVNDLHVRDPSMTQKEVRVSSIDNFQGEEANIIIASLVRSNAIGLIGFLKEPQRVNVLLSRARCGLFLIGNKETLTYKSGKEVWKPILEIIKDRGQLQDGLPTVCQLHPDDDPVVLKTKSDFRRYRPNGGCDRTCTFRMQCGHACSKACHPTDATHLISQKECTQPCGRFPPECNRNHICKKRCNQDCGGCQEIVGPIFIPCGHVLDTTRCHLVRNDESLVKLTEYCRVPVTWTFENCKHVCETTCFNARLDVPKCPLKCGHPLTCGHCCTNDCGSCESNHTCTIKCERQLFCSHICSRPCHDGQDCQECTKKCQRTCVHSTCPKLCHEPCASCIEPCDWACEHKGKCPLVCGAPCSRIPCNRRCSKKLDCGHQCPSVCGETCPPISYCQICGNKQMEIPDVIMMQPYENVNLMDDPILVLPCRHFYSMSTLDGLFSMNSFYEYDISGSPTKLRIFDPSEITEKGILCPECRHPVNSIYRYGRILKFSELRALERKTMISLDNTLKSLDEHGNKNKIAILKLLEKKIELSPMKVVWQACGGTSDLVISKPPSTQHLRILEQLAIAYGTKIEEFHDANYRQAIQYFQKAIQIAMDSNSHYSNARLRLALSRFIISWCSDTLQVRTEVKELLSWVLEQTLFESFKNEAMALLIRMETPSKQIVAEIVRAMDVRKGYDYGGSSTSHWFECPKGHPYFIGECGGAMEISRCIECGEQVGGQHHSLLSSNTSSSLIRDAMSSN